MDNLIWAPAAIQDIEIIADYIARDSKIQASLFVLQIIELTEKLIDFPLLGRIIPEIGDASSRELIYKGYRIMYKIENNSIYITGVIHGAINWNK